MPKHILQVDQPLFETELDRMVTQKVTQVLNRMLDAEITSGFLRSFEVVGA
jgi:hypothetical protein